MMLLYEYIHQLLLFLTKEIRVSLNTIYNKASKNSLHHTLAKQLNNQVITLEWNTRFLNYNERNIIIIHLKIPLPQNKSSHEINFSHYSLHGKTQIWKRKRTTSPVSSTPFLLAQVIALSKNEDHPRGIESRSGK